VVAVPQLSRQRSIAVLGICCLSLFMIGLDDTIVNIALPTISRGLHASVSGLQWIVDGYTMTLASLLIFGGATADRFGRRRVFLVGLAAFTAGSALCSAAPSLGWLIAFRVLQAAGGSMLNPVAVSIISGVFPGRAARARAISVWVGMFGVGMALGPSLGGILAGTAGWRGIFWVNIPVGLCAIALASAFVPESRAAAPRRPDPVAQVLVIIALGSLAYAIIEGAYSGWRAPAIRGLFLVAAAALAMLAGQELRRKEPLIDLRCFRSPSFTAAVLIAVCAFADLGGFLFLTSIYLQDVRGYPVLDAGLYLLPTAAAMAACPSLAAWLTSKTGSARLPLVTGGLALMISTNSMSRFTGSSSGACLLVAFGLFGVGMGMVNSQISVAAVAGMPPEQAGLASGIASAGRLLGQALGVAVAGSLLTARAHGQLHATFGPASYPAWHVLFWCGSAVVICGLVTRRAPARHSTARDPLQGTHPSRQHMPLQPQGTAQPLSSWTPPRPPEPVWLPRFLMTMQPLLMDIHSPGDPEPGPVFPGNSPGRLPPAEPVG
jgi:EmrB/QacA subfamily drug resistance transporter